MEEDSERRVYVGECGCVRIETKHFRATVQPAEFVEILREIVRKQKLKRRPNNHLKIQNNVDGSIGFFRIKNQKEGK